MEDLIYKTVSNNEKFTNQDLQDKLISFEQTVLQKQKNNLAFWVALYEFKRVFSPNNSEYFIQRTEQGKGYYFNEFMEKHFGISDGQVRKICLVVKRFTNYSEAFVDERKNLDNSIQLTPMLAGFSPAKLFELLSLTDKQIQESTKKGLLEPEMTEKEIREYIKSLKGKPKKNEQVEEEDVEDEVEHVDSKTELKKISEDCFDYYKDLRRISRENLISLLYVAIDKIDNLQNNLEEQEDQRDWKDVSCDKEFILKELADYKLQYLDMDVVEE